MPSRPAPGLSEEDTAWVEELTRSWLEVHKKSATTLVLLRLVRDHGPVSAAQLAPLVEDATGWGLSERGLYRSLRRLADAGALEISRADVARTGAKRQDFTLTAVGHHHLEGIERARLQ
ncbi:helix-turn-helix transcriptional regulator [Brachybacterium sillae]|uniref:helix-turn-helix transcriptional regulator n=1 Tax=Brachybacterium sillae TaxID=2810536 RepID=UPI00217CF2E0|nr:helix-turn-helix transcriptional regulator [Brachybacterium sillae]